MAGFSCEAQEFLAQCNCQQLEEKIRISSDDLFISEECLFFIKDGMLLPLVAVFADAEGLYILPSSLEAAIIRRNECPNGRSIWCRQCGGCGFYWCKFCCNCG